MTYILMVYLTNTDESVGIEITQDEIEYEPIEEIAAQICAGGFYDDASKTFYPPHRIHEIIIDRI